MPKTVTGNRPKPPDRPSTHVFRPGPKVSTTSHLDKAQSLHEWATSSPEELAIISRRVRALRARIARDNIDEFIEFVMRNEETREPLVQSPLQDEFQRLFSKHDRLMLWTFPEAGKALPLDTPIPTPYGWTTMGELEVGDAVFARDGSVCDVTSKSKIHLNNDCFRISFDDGTSMIADADHQWIVKHEGTEQVVSTRDLLRPGLWEVPICEPMQAPVRDPKSTPAAGHLFGSIEQRLALQDPPADVLRSLGFKVYADGRATKERYKSIIAVTPVPSVKTQCISVNSSDCSYIAGPDYTVTHNTLNVVGRILWELGRNPGLRIAYISSVQNQADKALDLVKSYITHSDELHEVFPDLHPGETWKGDAITIRRATHAKDFSIQCAPAGASGIQGSRIDLLILDDILNYDNTLTEHRRNYMESWYKNTLSTRLTANARVWVLGNAFHPDDLYHRFASMPGWVWKRFPVVDEDGTPIWPHQWPAERIAKKRDELGALFAQQFLCQARDESASRFKKAWLEKCLKRGEGKSFTYALSAIPPGYRVYTGVDLGLRKKAGSDQSCFFTICVHPDETREILCIEAGRWSGPEIVQRIVDTHHRFGSIVYVESVAAQKFILEFATAVSSVPVLPFQTGKNKHDPAFGFESLGAEMANGKWIIPNADGRIHPEVEHWIRELLYYDPDAHTGDRAMASWIAREAARVQPKRRGTVRTMDTMSR